MKHVLKYGSEREYRHADFVGGLARPHIAMSADSWKTFSQRLTDVHVGDICVFGENGLRFLPIEQYDKMKGMLDTPIGVVVIPPSHSMDGKPVLVSLSNMSLNTPEDGSLAEEPIDDDNYMIWGRYDYDVPGLEANSMVPILDSGGTSVGLADYGYMPSENQFGGGISGDGISMYAGDMHIPSPYNYDGSKNPLYADRRTILSMMDGKQNTASIRDEIDYFGPVSNIQERYPAAHCCMLYHTDGTKQGDWYLPSIGELGYLVCRLNLINASIKKAGGVCVGDIKTGAKLGFWLWSSSEYSRDRAWSLGTYRGGAYYDFKGNTTNDNRVRAFLRFS